MPDNFAADSFHTKKLCSRLSSSEVRFFYGNRPSFVWCKNLDRSFFRFVTIHACDRRTDGQTDRQMDRILIAIPRLQYM